MKRPQSRGYSILAALVFVAVLSGVTFAIQTISPSQVFTGTDAESQLSAAATTKQTEAEQKAIEEKNKQICDEMKQAGAKRGSNVEVPIVQPFTKNTTEDRRCIGAVFDSSSDVAQKLQSIGQDPKKDPRAYKCVGRSVKIYMDEKGKGNIISESKADVLAGKCQTQFCDKDGKKCSPATHVDGGRGIQEWATSDPKTYKGLPPAVQEGAKELGPLAGLPHGNQLGLKEAFEERVEENKAKINELDKTIAACSGTPDPFNLGSPDCSADVQKRDALVQENKKLEEQMAGLGKDVKSIESKEESAGKLGSCAGGQVWISGSCYEYNGGSKNGACAAGQESISGNCYTKKGEETPAGQKPPAGTCPAGTAGTFPDCKASKTTFTPQGPCQNGGMLPDCKAPSNTGCTGSNCNNGGGGGGGNSGGGGFGGSGKNSPLSALGNFMQGLMKGLGAQKGPPCPADPNAYAQAQQQYQMQLQQYNMQLQQYNYQQQIAMHNGYPPPPAPVEPVPCSHNNNANSCPASPPQPAPEGCKDGTWRPQTTQQSNGKQCTTGWQCAPGNSRPPQAELTCQPEVADVGMSVSIAYSCTNATTSSGSGFMTGGATSGATSTVLSNPPANARTATFALTCRNQNLTAKAECKVQIARPKVSIVARPNPVREGATTTVAWVSSGMNSCVVSSPQLPEFTEANADDERVNGTASTPAITQETQVVITCQTVGGNTKTASTTIRVASSTPESIIYMRSTLDGKTGVRHGATTTITWSTEGAPADSALSLWLYDERMQTESGLIASGLALSGTLDWALPSATSTCTEASPLCAADLVAGRSYSIEAALYTPKDAYFGTQPQANSKKPKYINGIYQQPFKMAD